ncbi:hypothetical protein RFF05_05085 [Bengtsoniella intestinalis]|uniref:hypothetical protein n=1 Tax=Bengtsoniella intestinalis TaxID=3073143 RepID=UPI00391FC1DC
MRYISKGELQQQTGDMITVMHYGQRLSIGDADAQIWLAGQGGLNQAEERLLCNLAGRGLISCTETIGNETIEVFRVLSGCILVPRRRFAIGKKTSIEREVLTWLRFAGLRMTIAELVQLRTQGIAPVATLLGESNRQALVETLYTTTNIADLVLEAQMEHSPSMPLVVDGVLQLIRKGAVSVL